MACVEWMMKGPSFGNCNCDWGCPCQFNKPPTHGDCRAMGSMRIDEGYFGDTRLDGLCWVETFAWPGAVHQGNGSHQAIIDVRADEKQRHALTEILQGRESEEGANVFQIFGSTYSTIHDPLFLPIEFECDIENCKARVSVPGVLETTGEPMKDPFTGEDHRVKLVIPGGMEFTETECGSGTTKATGVVPLDFKNSWGQFSIYHITHKGVVRP